jgi:hypothetical protein
MANNMVGGCDCFLPRADDCAKFGWPHGCYWKRRNMRDQAAEIRRLRWAIYQAGSMHAGGKPIDEIMTLLHDALNTEAETDDGNGQT